MTQRQEKLIENYVRTKVRRMLKEAVLKPSDFVGSTIKTIYHSTSEKSWVIVTNKGVFKIDKAQSFIGSESE